MIYDSQSHFKVAKELWTKRKEEIRNPQADDAWMKRKIHVAGIQSGKLFCAVPK
jgi:hypothetical protein